MLEHMSDYAQSPYAGIGYFREAQKRMGEPVASEFMRLYTAPGVDHVGSGAPANVDMLSVLVDWVENGRAPDDLTVGRAAARAADHGRPCAAALPVAELAALTGKAMPRAQPVSSARRDGLARRSALRISVGSSGM